MQYLHKIMVQYHLLIASMEKIHVLLPINISKNIETFLSLIHSANFDCTGHTPIDILSSPPYHARTYCKGDRGVQFVKVHLIGTKSSGKTHLQACLYKALNETQNYANASEELRNQADRIRPGSKILPSREGLDEILTFSNNKNEFKIICHMGELFKSLSHFDHSVSESAGINANDVTICIVNPFRSDKDLAWSAFKLFVKELMSKNMRFSDAAKFAFEHLFVSKLDDNIKLSGGDIEIYNFSRRYDYTSEEARAAGGPSVTWEEIFEDNHNSIFEILCDDLKNSVEILIEKHVARNSGVREVARKSRYGIVLLSHLDMLSYIKDLNQNKIDNVFNYFLGNQHERYVWQQMATPHLRTKLAFSTIDVDGSARVCCEVQVDGFDKNLLPDLIYRIESAFTAQSEYIARPTSLRELASGINSLFWQYWSGRRD